jgi:hypothetical protein
MLVRLLESYTGGTVGAAGAFFAVRRVLFGHYGAHLSRDFGSALLAREAGMRAVLEPAAVCYVHSSHTIAAEYRRKVRTMTRGLQTLFCHFRLANPFRYGLFSLKLLSHKLARWLAPLLGVIALASSLWLMRGTVAGLALLIALTALAAVGVVGVFSARRSLWPPLSRVAYLVVANIAVVRAWLNVLAGDRTPFWSPTERGADGLAG